MSPETQHAYNIACVALLFIFIVFLITVSCLMYFMKNWKYERDVAYNVLKTRFGTIENIANEIAVFEFKEKRAQVSLGDKKFQSAVVRIKYEIEKAVIRFK